MRDELAHVAKFAYKLAHSGKYEDFAAVERELIALGLADEVRSLDVPEIRSTLTMLCATARKREDEAASRRH